VASRRSNLAALCLATVVAVGACEILLRILLPAPPLVNLGTQQGAGISVVPTGTTSRRISNLYLQTDKGLRLRPNVSLKIERYPVGGRTVEISSDDLGLRRVSRSAAAATRTTRILFSGDSVVFGEGVSDSETFDQLLEGRLLGDGARLQVFNAGVPGYGLANEIEFLEDLGPTLTPSVNVLVLYLNDAIPSPSVKIYSPPDVLRSSYLVAQVFIAASRIMGRISATDRFMPDSTSVERWQREVLSDPGNPSRAIAAGHLEDWGVAWSDGVWAYLQPLLARFDEASRAMGARSILVVTPVRLQVDSTTLDDRPQRRLRELATALRIPVIDILPGLRQDFRKGGQDLFLDDCHFTPHGHQVVADILGIGLDRHLAQASSSHAKSMP